MNDFMKDIKNGLMFGICALMVIMIAGTISHSLEKRTNEQINELKEVIEFQNEKINQLSKICSTNQLINNAQSLRITENENQNLELFTEIVNTQEILDWTQTNLNEKIMSIEELVNE